MRLIAIFACLLCAFKSAWSTCGAQDFSDLLSQHCQSWCGSAAPQGSTFTPRVGTAGPKGDAGSRGPIGSPGEPGISGSPGPEGRQGEAGPPGRVNMTEISRIIKSEVESAIAFLNIKSCEDVSVNAAKSWNGSGGVFEIASPIKFGRLDVYCDVTTDGGKWTVIQRRVDGSLDFYRDWRSYADGFGNVNGEFWLGLKIIHELTKGRDQELKIDMIDINGVQYTAKYSTFYIGVEYDQYKLTVGGFSGNASDSMVYHNNLKFTTKDRDHDTSGTSNCANDRKGAWWYGSCAFSNLNGDYENTSGWPGVVWYNHGTKQRMYMRYTEMKIRRKK